MKTDIIKALRAVNNDQLAEIALRLAELHPEAFERELIAEMNIETNYRFVIPFSKQIVSLTTKQLNDLKSSALTGNKVMGIKIIREATSIGLKEAKDLWEDMEIKKVFDYKPENYRSSY
jgi:ribosomal protein L7/L12